MQVGAPHGSDPRSVAAEAERYLVGGFLIPASVEEIQAVARVLCVEAFSDEKVARVYSACVRIAERDDVAPTIEAVVAELGLTDTQPAPPEVKSTPRTKDPQSFVERLVSRVRARWNGVPTFPEIETALSRDVFVLARDPIELERVRRFLEDHVPTTRNYAGHMIDEAIRKRRLSRSAPAPESEPEVDVTGEADFPEDAEERLSREYGVFPHPPVANWSKYYPAIIADVSRPSRVKTWEQRSLHET